MSSGMDPSARQLPLLISLDDAMTRDNWLSRPETATLEQLLFTGEDSAFIRGEPGLGKSHLLQAVCHQSGGLYLPLGALLDMPPMALLECTESAQLLALDELDALVDQPDWQEALFHLFNRALPLGTRLIMAGRKAPAALPGLLPDLRSRLESLPLFAMPRFSEAALDALLSLRGDRRGVRLGNEVRSYVLRRAGRSPADLMALLEQLDREALARGRAITIPLIRALRLPSLDP